MDTKGLMMVRVLFNSFDKDNIASILQKHALPEIQEQVLAQTMETADPMSAWVTPVALLNRIHYSWLHPIIQQLPQEFSAHFLSALPEYHFSGLSKMLNQKLTRIPLSPAVGQFFITELCSHLNIASLLPPAFLPASKLNALVDFTKQQMMEMIDFLGLHDLGEEMRFILNKTQIKTLFNQLSARKQKYLKICMANKERFPVARLALDQWQGTRQQLEVMLHKRGIERLGKALAGQHHDLIWYVVHVLDTGRGMLLTKSIPLHEEAGVTPYRSQQLLSLINFLKEEPHDE